jgi:hypothetical protein
MYLGEEWLSGAAPPRLESGEPAVSASLRGAYPHPPLLHVRLQLDAAEREA